MGTPEDKFWSDYLSEHSRQNAVEPPLRNTLDYLDLIPCAVIATFIYFAIQNLVH